MVEVGDKGTIGIAPRSLPKGLGGRRCGGVARGTRGRGPRLRPSICHPIWVIHVNRHVELVVPASAAEAARGITGHPYCSWSRIVSARAPTSCLGVN